jgi:hypothetical protein
MPSTLKQDPRYFATSTKEAAASDPRSSDPGFSMLLPVRLYVNGTMDVGSRITRMSSEVLLVPDCRLPTFPRTIAADPDSSTLLTLSQRGCQQSHQSLI